MSQSVYHDRELRLMCQCYGVFVVLAVAAIALVLVVAR